jgi:hypothetical protein
VNELEFCFKNCTSEKGYEIIFLPILCCSRVTLKTVSLRDCQVSELYRQEYRSSRRGTAFPRRTRQLSENRRHPILPKLGTRTPRKPRRTLVRGGCTALLAAAQARACLPTAVDVPAALAASSEQRMSDSSRAAALPGCRLRQGSGC